MGSQSSWQRVDGKRLHDFIADDKRLQASLDPTAVAPRLWRSGKGHARHIDQPLDLRSDHRTHEIDSRGT